jgi:hypothetical protein
MRDYQELTTSYSDDAVDQAIRVFTTPLPNSSDDPRHIRYPQGTSVVEDIKHFQAEDHAGRHAGGPKPAPHSITYTILAVLVAMWLLIQDSKQVHIGAITNILLHQISPTSRHKVGMTAHLGNTRAAVDRAGRSPNAPLTLAKEGRQAYNSETHRVAKFTRAMFTTYDPSPFYKDDTLTSEQRKRARASQADKSTSGRPTRSQRGAGAAVDGQTRRVGVKMTNALKKEILNNENHPDRRIDSATIVRNRHRLESIMNKIVAAVVPPGFPETYEHDIAVDETLSIVYRARHGHGIRENKLCAADPDAEYWAGKDSDDPEKGFGYGIEILWRAGRPYSRRLPMIPIAINIGRPGGGNMDLVRRAHDLGVQFGTITDNPQKRGYFIADMGYSPLDNYLPFILNNKYRPVFQMPKNWKHHETLPDVGAHGQPVNGAHLLGGTVCCPALNNITPLTPLPFKYEEGDQEILKRAATTKDIALHKMPVRNSLRPLGKKNIAKQREYTLADEYAITVECPHAAGQVECPIKRGLTGGRRNPSLPELNVQHMPTNTDDLPQVCRQKHTTLRLTPQQAKKIQPLIHGSHIWHDIYNTVRSANERGNNTLTNPSAIGASGEWTEQRGIAKQGLFWSIAAAQASLLLQRDFNTKHIGADGLPTFPPREYERRRRQELINPRRNHQNGSAPDSQNR